MKIVVYDESSVSCCVERAFGLIRTIENFACKEQMDKAGLLK